MNINYVAYRVACRWAPLTRAPISCCCYLILCCCCYRYGRAAPACWQFCLFAVCCYLLPMPVATGSPISFECIRSQVNKQQLKQPQKHVEEKEAEDKTVARMLFDFLVLALKSFELTCCATATRRDGTGRGLGLGGEGEVGQLRQEFPSSRRSS